MTGSLRTFVPALAALAAAAFAAPAASAAVAVAVQDPVPIRPNMYFTATVNGASSQAVVKMVCPGPATPGELGHPLDGQVVEVESVLPPSVVPLGYTGSAATSIDALFGPSASTAGPIVLTSFFAPVKIPTTLLLPCSGTGSVSFVPIPTSPTARGVSVSVVFANIAA